MNPHYNQNYTREEIENVLAEIKECISNDRYSISKNERRLENVRFINDYNLRHARQKEILLQISVEDFCHTLQNTKKGYEYETLYVFVPQVMLYNIDDIRETVDIYIKFNIIERANGNRVGVISFHKRNKPIDYLFR